jgi:electron transport complex protein RnfC
MFLMPRDIETAYITKNYTDAHKLDVNACIECGVCSYVCPARRPLVQAMRMCKRVLRDRGIK